MKYGRNCLYFLREDKQKKIVFFNVRATKGVRRINAPEYSGKKKLFFSQIRLFYPKNWEERKKIAKNPFQAIKGLKKEKKKWHGPLSH